MSVWTILLVAVPVAGLGLAWAISWWRMASIAVPPNLVVVRGAFSRLAERELGAPNHIEAETRNLLPDTPLHADRFHVAGVSAPASRVARAASWGAAAADGAIPAVDVWLRWASVDPHVFQAVAHMTHEQIDGFADLLRVVDAKGYALGTDGFFNKLLGHAGEWHVQEHLMQAGVAVAMPAGTTEPGTDLWADGHPVQVKAWANAGAAAHAHFADHPDIPMVVPADASHIPPDALHFNPTHGLDTGVLASTDHLTVVDDALSHADLVDQTANATDVLEDPGPALHFPWVTMAVSGYREGRLLMNGHTELTRAAKNVAVDTAAVGGGGLVGAKAGALAGSFFGPIGTVVGGIAGGVIGALGGRAAANAVKRMPLDDAKDAYELAASAYRDSERRVSEEAGNSWKTAQAEQQKRFTVVVRRLRSELEHETDQLKTELQSAVVLDASSARAYLSATEASVASDLRIAEERLRRATGTLGRFFPGLSAPALWAQTRQLRGDIRVWRLAGERLLQAWTPSPSSTAALFDHMLAAPTGEIVASSFLASTRDFRERTYRQLHAVTQGTMSRLIESRRQAVDALRTAWEHIKSAAERQLAPFIDALRARSEDYRSELRKAGVKV